MERASNSPGNNEILLSFCDEDIGKSFASHLQSALNKKGIDTIRHEAEVIGRDLKCSVIIFSPNYASSASRLDEVVKILEWKDTLGHKLIPVFCEVYPADVGKLRGIFGVVFSKHGHDPREPGWREALAKVGEISGKHFEKNRDEAQFVKEIVGEVSSKLKNVTSLNVSDDFSLLNSRVGVAGLISYLSTWLAVVDNLSVGILSPTLQSSITPQPSSMGYRGVCRLDVDNSALTRRRFC